MRFGSSNTTRRSRNPSCTLCSHHGVRSELKGHKYRCLFIECECELCVRGRKRREVMRKQVRLRRQQMKHYSKEALKTETALKTEKTIENTCTYVDEQTASRIYRRKRTYEGVVNQPETLPSVSTNHQSSQTTMENTAPYYEYSRFPTHVNPFLQNNEPFAYYLSLSPPGISTPPKDHSPGQRATSSLVGRRLSVSENSAFVKFPPRHHMLLEAGISTTEGWPSEVKESKEAALALASLQHK